MLNEENEVSHKLCMVNILNMSLGYFKPILMDIRIILSSKMVANCTMLYLFNGEQLLKSDFTVRISGPKAINSPLQQF